MYTYRVVAAHARSLARTPTAPNSSYGFTSRADSSTPISEPYHICASICAVFLNLLDRTTSIDLSCLAIRTMRRPPEAVEVGKHERRSRASPAIVAVEESMLGPWLVSFTAPRYLGLLFLISFLGRRRGVQSRYGANPPRIYPPSPS